ncbi:MAG TPA: ornithine cyclodeaminase family protein [Gemmatimonadales bacterium]|nr:ornithine cyclodeaminase family protein [Gemmatimonadales bacterium]
MSVAPIHRPATADADAGQGTLVLTREDVMRLLPMPACIEAVERAFERHARDETISPGVLGTHVDGGGFHVKTAGLQDAVDGRPVFAAKVNANFPGNPDQRGLPTIQGVIALFDASDGRVLALLDSIEITSLRTAAATAVAAKHLAPHRGNVTICGCGEQSRHQLRALACVRTLARVKAFDVNASRAARFAADMAAELGLEVTAIAELGDGAAATDIWVTCTTARRWFLGRAHVAPGAFVAAVGADNPEKQEIEPELLAGSAVVADVLDQCTAIGDLHHAIAAGLMRREQVRAELADVVSGRKSGRRSPEEIVVFDSTGTALQDVAAAALAYQRARATGAGFTVRLGGGGDGQRLGL